MIPAPITVPRRGNARWNRRVIAFSELIGCLVGPRGKRLLLIVLWALLGGWLGGSGAAAGAESTPQEPASFTYEPKGQRDPFVALVWEGRFVGVYKGEAGGGGSSPVQLSGILWDPAGQSIALINDSEVRVGQFVGDYQVQEIRKDAVVLVHPEGEAMVLRLFEEELP